MERRSVPPVDPVVGLVLKLLGEAIQAGASSLEFYPENDSLVAAITVGGTKRVSDRVPSPSVRDGLPRLVKQYAGLSTKETDQPQAGLLTVEIDGKRATLPVHTTPLPGNGEGVSIDVSGCAAAGAGAASAPVVVLVDPPPDPVMKILASQTTDGRFLAWPDTGAINMTGAVLRALNAFHNGRDALQTTLCLLALQLLHKPRAAVWQRAHAKGCRHVADELKVQPSDVVALLDRLEQEFSPAQQPVA